MRSSTKHVAVTTEHIGDDEIRITVHDIDFLLECYWNRTLRLGRQTVFNPPGLTAGTRCLVVDLMRRGTVLEVEVSKNVLLMRKLGNKDWDNTETFIHSRLRRLIADSKKQ